MAGSLGSSGARAPLGRTGLEVSRLCLGGNVFGWTADRRTSFEILDAYLASDGNFVDTADVYSSWVDGNVGGESERVLGDWMRARGSRDRIVVATKVGSLGGLGGPNIVQKVEASLRRLGTDHVDLLYAHRDDPGVPLDETLVALDRLVQDGKVRHIAASNYTAERLVAALEVSRRHGLAEFAVLQPQYNLVERAYERETASACAREGLACVPYYGLASGFLTGKYRRGAPAAGRRAERSTQYLDDRGLRVLDALDAVATRHRASMAAVALAWLAAQPTVVSPIASATSVEQLAQLVPCMAMELGTEDLGALSLASAR